MSKGTNARHRAGWLPADPKALVAWIEDLRKVDKTAYKPSVQKLKRLIDDDPVVRMYFTKMIDQVPGYYRDKPGGYLRSIDEMLDLINRAMDRAPKFSKDSLVGFPINAILDHTMGMPAGFPVFRNEKVNEAFKEILEEYRKKCLDTPTSLSVLNKRPGGWMCKTAADKLKMDAYQYDPHAEHWGFKSFNDFFTRKLAVNPDGTFKKRPIAEPDNPRVIVSACDSDVYAIQKNVKKQDWFWVKSQPYSLQDMLSPRGREYADPFIGGDVYQAFLNAYSYHRWHTPVSGKILDAFVIPGTYYSEAEAEGMDLAGPNDSQGYITHVATRAVLFIEADDPTIGLMCIMFVGMAEVSSCIIDKKCKKPGHHVKKGKDELGYFQYGGSTYCMIFRPGVIDRFTAEENKRYLVGQEIARTRQ